MTLPNFFIVGAPKAGTDALYYDLCQHPEIYMSPLKEPCYFSSEVRVENFEAALQPRMQATVAMTKQYLADGMPGHRFGGIISEFSDYLQLFSKVGNEKAIGEGSVCYLWSRTAAAAIAEANPDARILIVLMDPAERAFQQYLKSRSDGMAPHSFAKHLDRAFHAGPEFSIYHPFLDFGNYAAQVGRYMDAFPAEQLSISLYEDMQASHAAWFSNVLAFLGVENSFIPREINVPSDPYLPRIAWISRALRHAKLKSLVRELLPPGVKSPMKKLIYREGNPPTIQPKDRSRLIAYYRNDILRLQELLGRDLSAWIR
jgi:hypothetical protein